MNRIANPITPLTGRLSQALRRAPLGAFFLAAMSVALTGCSLGTMQLSGAEPGPTSLAIRVSGTVHGGQNPISGSAIQLWAVGSSGYGSQATPLVLLNGSSSCSQTSLTITGFSITSNVVTINTSANTLAPGESVVISGLSTGTYLNGTTLTVISATATSFTAAFTNANVGSTTDSGTATPECPGVTTSASGGFSIDGDYTCPSASSLVYLTATGGNPGLTSGTNNTAIKLMAPLGTCSGLTGSTVLMNEVTTVAGAFALAQYFTPTFGATSNHSFGAPSTSQAQTGITNAFGTYANLATTSTGSAVTQVNLTGTLSTSYPYTISVVPDSAKIYTMANILAACVNSTSASSTNCTALFGAVVPVGGVTPTDVLQAAVDMALNPTSNNSNGSSTNLTNLFNLQSPSSPYVGAAGAGLTATPTDWTVAVQYQDTTGNYFLKPQNLSIDSTGNVWVLSNNSAAGALVELSPTGTPTTFVTTLNEYGPFASPVASPPVLSSLKTTQAEPFGYQNTVFTNNFGNSAGGLNPAVNPRNLAIDTNNNVWFTTSSSTTDATTSIPSNGNIFEVTPSGSSFGFATGKAAYGLAIDGNNDVFVSQESSSAYFGMYEFPAGNLLTPITYQIATKTVGTPAASGTNSYIEPEYMAFDTSGNLWMTAGSASASQNFAVALGNINTGALVTGNTASAAYPCSTLTSGEYCYVATSTTTNTYYTTSIAITQPWGLAAGAGSMYIADAGSSGTAPDYTITKISGTAAPATATFANLGTSSSIIFPHYLAVDGSGNVWVGSQGGTVGSTTVSGGISELTSTGTALSPTTNATQPGFAHSALTAAAGVGIDPSGNVWVANGAAYTPAVSGGAAAVPSLVVELVGAASPTVTPTALALKNGTVAQKP